MVVRVDLGFIGHKGQTLDIFRDDTLMCPQCTRYGYVYKTAKVFHRYYEKPEKRTHKVFCYCGYCNHEWTREIRQRSGWDKEFLV